MTKKELPKLYLKRENEEDDTGTETAKDYLEKIAKADRMIQRLTDMAASLRSKLISPSYELRQDKVQGFIPKDKFSESVIKVIEFEDEINARIDELIDMKREALNRIYNISDFDLQNVLIARYIAFKKWEDIALELSFSIPHVYRLHRKALRQFGGQLGVDS